jgi:hypothetical protein
MVRMSSDSDSQANKFQRAFIKEAIEHFGGQRELAIAISSTQQNISKYKECKQGISVSRLIHISKIMGKDKITITWE